MSNTDDMVWQRSSLCSNSACVEVAFAGSMVLVRDAKRTSGAVLSYTDEEWDAFLGGVRAGEFDRPRRSGGLN